MCGKKICCRCKAEKSLIDFNKDRQFNDGLRPFCRECARAEWSDRYLKNKDKERIRKAAFYKKNKDKILSRTANWLKENRAYGTMKVAKRRADKNRSTPPWLSEIHLRQIKWYYQVAEMFTSQTGIANHVDHIHPINGVGFCGLHVPWNLRVIKGSENSIKSNKPPVEETSLFWS